MYKNKDKQKQANKEIQRRKRGVTVGPSKVLLSMEGVTGVTEPQGVTRGAVMEGVTGVPVEARVLAPWTIDSIKAALVNRALKELPDDSAERWERAIGYYHWLLAGRPVYE